MKKFDKGHIYSTLISSLFSSSAVIFIFADVIFDEEFFSDSMWAKIAVIAGFYFLFYIGRVIYTILYISSSGYELTETELRTKTGVIGRKSSVLSYTKIHAVNKKQSVFQRVFNVATLTVDSGATGNAFGAEITIIENEDEVDRLMVRIKRLQAGEAFENVSAADEVSLREPPRENLYSFSSRLKMIYSALNVGTSVILIAFLAVIAVIALGVASAILRSTPDFSVSELWFGAFFLTLIALILTSIISLIAGICTSFFSYHDFKVHKNRDDLEISYGLFVRHTNNFKYKRIKAIKIMESPIERLFGYASAGLEVVGYGTENSSDSAEDNKSAAPGMLLPLTKATMLDETLERLMPAYIPDKIEHKARSYASFVLFPCLFIAIGYASAFLSAWAVITFLALPTVYSMYALTVAAGAMLISILITLTVKALEYKNSGIALGNGKLTIQNGAFTRRRTVILTKDVIGIERISTPMRMKRGISSYNIHFFANALTNTVTVRNLDISVADKLEAMLKD